MTLLTNRINCDGSKLFSKVVFRAYYVMYGFCVLFVAGKQQLFQSLLTHPEGSLTYYKLCSK